ncbi:hypothetical protein [uncultured Limnobacter sp.]|uniref:hypothetical protein n=1 Tax=uncultured Limnobacter sp. TaxID=199681 RepID=UPI0030F71314
MKFPDPEQINFAAYQKYENEMYGLFGPNWEKLAPDDFKEYSLQEWKKKAELDIHKKIILNQILEPLRTTRKWISKLLNK